MLAPALRPPGEAINVARRLTMKAAARLRRMGYTATYFGFAARLEDGRKNGWRDALPPRADSPAFLAMLLAIWDRTIIRERGIAIKKISVVMLGLADGNSIQLSLFDTSSGKAEEKLENSPRSLRLSHALDHLNHKFGRDTVLIGMLPSAGRGFSGTKIAFTSIPRSGRVLE